MSVIEVVGTPTVVTLTELAAVSVVATLPFPTSGYQGGFPVFIQETTPVTDASSYLWAKPSTGEIWIEDGS